MKIMNTNTLSIFKINQQLTEGGCPSTYCKIADNTGCAIKNGQIQGIYKVRYSGGDKDIEIPAEELHRLYRKSDAWEKKNAARINDPEEPNEPNFDDKGMPIYKPDHI